MARFIFSFGALSPCALAMVNALILSAAAWRVRALSVMSLLVIAARCPAHTTDTSYARVRIFDDRLEVRLTCDIFTLAKIVPGLDSNGDLALSREELRNATRAVRQFFASHVGMEVNGVLTALAGGKDPFWPLDAPDPVPAKQWHATETLVSFPFDIPLATPAKDVALLFDVFSVLGGSHVVLGVFEYRGQPTEVAFTQAEPDYLFDTAYAGTRGPPGRPAPPPATPLRSNADGSPRWRFFKMGIGHIFTGWDHLCFLLALLVVSRLRPLVAIVTSFTIAHSITLLVAAFGLVTLPTRMIECGIALTIIYVAVENLWRSDYGHRWKLTFFFGLIHGFGFANTLDPQQLPLEAKARCLLGFNLGVEAGQLAAVLTLLPLSILLAKWRHAASARAAVSVVVALLGLAWFLDRALALRWMPF